MSFVRNKYYFENIVRYIYRCLFSWEKVYKFFTASSNTGIQGYKDTDMYTHLRSVPL